ncbi:MAG: hypothetical protein L0Z50_06745 [Verrucomicrobiales bacterium]|nr:hypothetical protein [Verrucomicrobiales bacterium]
MIQANPFARAQNGAPTVPVRSTSPQQSVSRNPFLSWSAKTAATGDPVAVRLMVGLPDRGSVKAFQDP